MTGIWNAMNGKKQKMWLGNAGNASRPWQKSRKKQ